MEVLAVSTAPKLNLQHLKHFKFPNLSFNSHVSGLIASGDIKLATDCTPAMSPCAFPCHIKLPCQTDVDTVVAEFGSQ